MASKEIIEQLLGAEADAHFYTHPKSHVKGREKKIC